MDTLVNFHRQVLSVYEFCDGAVSFDGVLLPSPVWHGLLPVPGTFKPSHPQESLHSSLSWLEKKYESALLPEVWK